MIMTFYARASADVQVEEFTRLYERRVVVSVIRIGTAATPR